VSCLVAGREPCVPDGETGDPSIRLVLYWGSTGEYMGMGGQCQSGGRAERPGRRVMKLLPYSVLGRLEGGVDGLWPGGTWFGSAGESYAARWMGGQQPLYQRSRPEASE